MLWTNQLPTVSMCNFNIHFNDRWFGVAYTIMQNFTISKFMYNLSWTGTFLFTLWLYNRPDNSCLALLNVHLSNFAYLSFNITVRSLLQDLIDDNWHWLRWQTPNNHMNQCSPRCLLFLNQQRTFCLSHIRFIDGKYYHAIGVVEPFIYKPRF